jgi:hypothetical protein
MTIIISNHVPTLGEISYVNPFLHYFKDIISITASFFHYMWKHEKMYKIDIVTNFFKTLEYYQDVVKVI